MVNAYVLHCMAVVLVSAAVSFCLFRIINYIKGQRKKKQDSASGGILIIITIQEDAK